MRFKLVLSNLIPLAQDICLLRHLCQSSRTLRPPQISLRPQQSIQNLLKNILHRTLMTNRPLHPLDPPHHPSVMNVPSFPIELAELCFSHVQKFIPVKHRLTHRLHLMKDPTQSRLICGRALSQTYERLSDFPQHPLPTCVQCFASKLVGSFDEA